MYPCIKFGAADEKVHLVHSMYFEALKRALGSRGYAVSELFNDFTSAWHDAGDGNAFGIFGKTKDGPALRALTSSQSTAEKVVDALTLTHPQWGPTIREIEPPE